MEVTALDCGEGEAVFMVFPDRATALINTCGVGERSVRGISGSRWNAGEEIVSPFLWSRGIERLDVLALTHSPGEQRASAEALARNFKIGEVWLDTTGRSPAAYALLDDIKHAGARVREFEGGERMALGGASFHVLWPPARRENETLPSDGENLDSLVLQISDQEANILLAGHLDAKAARALVASGEPVASRLLQIYPRALAESSEDDFLHAVSPQVIWTSGVRSRGRPEALRAPEFRRPRFFRTDVDGAIQMTVNADRLALRVYRTSTGGGTGAGTGWLLTSPASSVP